MAQQHEIGKRATSVYQSDGMTCVRFHATEVVKFDKDKVVLDHGGWSTPATKTRMNQASSQFGLGFSVFQKDWDWFVKFDGEVLDFVNGMSLQRA